MEYEQKDQIIDLTNNPYEQEARERWGDQAVDRSKAHLAALPKAAQMQISAAMEEQLKTMASLRHLQPNDSVVQKAVSDYYTFLNSNFGITYTFEAFAGLGQMYAADERFQQNIDAYGDGLAAFLAQAMTIYATGG